MFQIGYKVQIHTTSTPEQAISHDIKQVCKIFHLYASIKIFIRVPDDTFCNFCHFSKIMKIQKSHYGHLYCINLQLWT